MAYNPEEDIKVSDLPEKTTDVVSDDKLLVIDSEDANILKQVDASKVWWWSGTWDMLKSVYDTNNNGIVDNAEALWWVAASAYAKTADVQPTLESGVNIKTINWNSILWPWNIEIQGGTWTVDTEMSDTSTNAVQNKVIKAYVDSQWWWGGTVDTAMSDTSTNAVQNKVIKEYVDGKWVKVFALTGSYSNSDLSNNWYIDLTESDAQLYEEANTYYLSWWLAIIKQSNRMYYPTWYYSDSVKTSFMDNKVDRNDSIFVTQRYITYNYNNKPQLRINEIVVQSPELTSGEKEIDWLTELVIRSASIADNFRKFSIQFTLTIISGSGSIIKQYSWVSQWDTLFWYGVNVKLPEWIYTDMNSSSSSSYGSKIFTLSDSTNRWNITWHLYYAWNFTDDIKFVFRNVNKTQSTNTLRLSWSLMTFPIP